LVDIETVLQETSNVILETDKMMAALGSGVVTSFTSTMPTEECGQEALVSTCFLQLIQSFLVAQARRVECVSFEQHMSMIRKLVTHLNRFCANGTWHKQVRVRPSWFSGFSATEVPPSAMPTVSVDTLHIRTPFMEQEQPIDSFFSDHVLAWTSRTPFLCLSTSRAEAFRALAQRMMLASAARDMLALDPSEWILVEMPCDKERAPRML
jgi:hypothetical protein